MIFSRIIILATQQENLFIQHGTKLKKKNTGSRYKNQDLNQYLLMKNEKVHRTVLKIIHLFNKIKLQQTDNSQEVNHTILKIKITLTKTNNNTKNTNEKKCYKYD